MNKRSCIYRAWFAVMLAAAGASARAGVIVHESVSIQNSGGVGGNGASTSDMIYSQYNTNGDGWGWAGGAGAVQGSSPTTNNGANTVPANETFKFNIGATVDSLNSTYGAGNWTVANPVLTFASSYAIQNNSRFGTESGTFDIYWVGNDNWAQSRGDAPPPGSDGNRLLNPIYASNAADLSTWAGDESLLGSETFTVPAGGGGYVNLTYNLALTAPLINDITSATASPTGTNPAASLYLMDTSSALAMIIFTGGQSQPLPTLSFDVTSVPEPASLSLVGVASLMLLRRRRIPSRISRA